jgi:hypothetical protein
VAEDLLTDFDDTEDFVDRSRLVGAFVGDREARVVHGGSG